MTEIENEDQFLISLRREDAGPDVSEFPDGEDLNDHFETVTEGEIDQLEDTD